MVTIPESLRSLFTATIHEEDGRYTVEIPAGELDHGTLEPGETYRVAVLGTAGTDTEPEPFAPVPDAEPTGRQPPDPPVEEGELRTVTIEAVGDQGDGIAKVDRGYVVIVPEAQPGQQPHVRIEEVRQNVAFASVVTAEERQ